ncbi:hypothetical protein LCGC14_0147520 [marine sediment metagenome]|uniref:Uncharacterized protein n=1 Tax=marine sediment metagenome TaxID=412755 RepID=A0A0F9V090_9ZZZZ
MSLDLGLITFIPGPGDYQRTALWGFGADPGVLSGIDKLTQKVVMLLLSDQGTDILNPGLGGGLKSLIGKTMDKPHIAGMMTAIGNSVTTVERQIFNLQAGEPVSLSETLLSLTLIQASYVKALTTIFIEVRLVNAEGVFSLVGILV